MQLEKNILIVLVLGFLIRLIISPFTYHSDIIPFDFAGFVIGKGNILNYYDFLPRLTEGDPILKTFPRNLFNYPPVGNKGDNI